MRRHVYPMLVGAVALAAPAVWGTTISFNLSADCRANCSNVGMAVDDLVIGSVTLSTANFAPSGPVTRADLVNFFIGFGRTSATIGKDFSPGYAFEATWGADTGSLEGVSFIASGSDVLNDPGPFISTGADGDTLSLQGTCFDVDCTRVSNENTAAIGPLTFRPTGDVTPVPLPPAALLMGAGVIVLVAATRRRSMPSAATTPRG